ncbi:precorrin-8X methylmutase [Mastigocoleus testarum]|uniref:Precorrin-8X methylmutase n=1 Tax=Mastigocoleus testarum BC008 TaxID=371196 RepID=A0A0V7ZDV6_9CYAN|nr:precorrin-8X methylmutase [Mastigocoleus testarum]KST62029.1 precorrin-8X methylmutase [Mastigocoleus testarum BC008]KST62637.1 precorrin-8X methylmutase [Mastigocoleus testarum BC008]
MEWHSSDAQSLTIIDREIGAHVFSPAEYEIVRRVIYATADFEYKSLIRFSEHALHAGAAALAARTAIVVDSPMVRVGISQTIQETFANPVYCGVETFTRPQKSKTVAAWGMENLAKRHLEGIFVIGQAQTALNTIIDLIEAEEIKPALVIATPAGFLNLAAAKESLKNSVIPHITLESDKGNAVVAAAIVDGLVDLAWQAYGKNG